MSLGLALLSGCLPELEPTDQDEDGHPAASDCDDTDAAVGSPATEICDGADNDCDGEIDEDLKEDRFLDSDEDGYGSSNPDEYISVCAEETTPGYVANNTDCNDDDDAYHPGAEENCDDPSDYNCDGSVSFDDADGDGFAACVDCDDADDSIHPENFEYCDGVDNDCDGNLDEPSAEDSQEWPADADGDGFGSPTETEVSCYAGDGTADNTDDCNDTDAGINPAAAEVCDADDVDENCNGAADDTDATTDYDSMTTWFYDGDGDSHGDENETIVQCEQPTNYVDNADDCDDTTSAISPDADEVCDADDVDEDCNGAADNDDAGADVSTKSTFFQDSDGDGHGLLTVPYAACDLPASGYATVYGDCNDADAAISPDAQEVCDAANADEDCDGYADDDDDYVEPSTESEWYRDDDGDGFGDDPTPVYYCDEPAGYAATNDDCNDDAATAYPGAAEVCDDGLDNACDGSASECTPTGSTSVTSMTARFYGDANDTAGFALAPLGDFLGASANDLAIGMPSYNDNSQPGAVCLLAAPLSGDYYPSDCSTTLTASTAGLRVGTDLLGGIDLSGDGQPDLVVGAHGQPSMNGTVWLLTSTPGSGSQNLETGGSAEATITGEDGNDHFGNILANLGDIIGDGDTYFGVGADYAANGAFTYAGAIYAFNGAVSGTLGAADATLIVRGDNAYDYFSYNFDACDFNGSGSTDLVATAPYHDGSGTNRGRLTIFFDMADGDYVGDDADVKISGPSDLTYYGQGVGCVGDIDGDGYDDIVAGSANISDVASLAGEAHLFLGQAGGTTTTTASAAATYQGISADDRAGNEVFAAGDWNDDGTQDIGVAATHYDDGVTTNTGIFYVMDGSSRGTVSLASALYAGYNTEAEAQFGCRVLGVTSMDSDATDDIIAGGPFDNTNGTDAGLVALGSGSGF